MKILITGGTGKVGQAVVQRFVEQGRDIHILGLEDDFSTEGATYAKCDIQDYADLREQMQGCQAVVHLAAIAHPMQTPSPALFQVNAAGTFNVFQAASEEGIKRVAQASSINAFGCFWGMTEIAPDSLPIDESHLTHTTDVYSFSKNIVEEIGDYYWRRDGISSVAFRLPGVMSQEQLTSEQHQERVQNGRAALDEFRTLPIEKQQARISRIREAIIAYRGQRMFEYPQASQGFDTAALQEQFANEPLWTQYLFERFNFWAYIDDRDAAQAIEKGITADYEGSHALFVNASQNSLNYESQVLAEIFFSTSKAKLQGSESLVSIDKARQLIGFEPLYTG